MTSGPLEMSALEDRRLALMLAFIAQAVIHLFAAVKPFLNHV